jgi:hypothetical protein
MIAGVASFIDCCGRRGCRIATVTGSLARGAKAALVFALFVPTYVGGCGGGPSSHANGSGGIAGTGGVSGTSGQDGSANASGGSSVAGTGGSSGVSGTGGTSGRGGASGPADASGGGGASSGGASGSGGVAGTPGSSGGASNTGGAFGGGGAAGAAGSGGGAACGRCAAYGTPTRTGQAPAALDNLSGIAASWRNPGVLFAHNDMTQAHVFALGTDGHVLARFALTNAGAVDIEDIGVGPCPGGSCVYLADIGGNLSASRVEFSIYRLTEPTVPSGGTTATTSVSFERFRFTYPDGANHNAESLLVDPASGALYIITKVTDAQPSAAYALANPPSANASNTLRKVADLTVPRPGDTPATSASAHPCGLGFLLRTNKVAYEFRIAAGAPFESAFGVAPVVVPTTTEPQSEAITYRADGQGYFTSGETAAAPLFTVTCQ